MTWPAMIILKKRSQRKKRSRLVRESYGSNLKTKLLKNWLPNTVQSVGLTSPKNSKKTIELVEELVNSVEKDGIII